LLRDLLSSCDQDHGKVRAAITGAVPDVFTDDFWLGQVFSDGPQARAALLRILSVRSEADIGLAENGSRVQRLHSMHLDGGRFGKTTPDDLDRSFATINASGANKHWLLLFPGLMSRCEVASGSSSTQWNLDCFPLLFLRDVGRWDQMCERLAEFGRHELFNALLSHCIAYVLAKVGKGAPQVIVHERIAAWRAESGDIAPYDEITGETIERPASGDEADITQIAALLRADKAFQDKLRQFVDRLKGSPQKICQTEKH
jgi:hypothetical protein